VPLWLEVSGWRERGQRRARQNCMKPKPTRPNVVFIVADDHRHDCLGVIDPQGVRTPVIDGLASGGVLFRGARIMGGANQAVCGPSCAALHTGCAPQEALELGAEPMQNGTSCIRATRVMLGGVFWAEGYATFGTGKWHNDGTSFKSLLDLKSLGNANAGG